MPRTVIPIAAPDISVLARTLGRELEGRVASPSHVELLNMLVRGIGYRNFQHFRSQRLAEARLATPPAALAPIDYRKVERAARLFDAEGIMIRWPKKASDRILCLWVMWSRLPAGRSMNETEVNALLNANHHFGDHAILRREMFGSGLVTRKRDGSDYRRIERAPPPEALALIRHLGRRAENA